MASIFLVVAISGLAVLMLAAYATHHVKLVSVCVLVSFVVAVSVVGVKVGSLSYPKPARFELDVVAKAKVLWFKIDKPILILLDWGQGPRYYEYDYSPELEQAMQKGRRDAQAKRTDLIMNRPFGDLKTNSKSGSDGGSSDGGSNKSNAADNIDESSRFSTPPPPTDPEKDQ